MELDLIRGFSDELTKIAFTEANAMRVSSLAKKIQLPGAAARSISRIIGAKLPIGAAPSLKRAKNVVAQGATALASPRNRFETSAISSQALGKARAQMPTVGLGSASANGSIIQGPGAVGALRSTVRQAHGIKLPNLHNPSSNRVLQGVLKGHELDELKVRPRLAALPLGHQSPDVLLREHNRVATLGPQHAGVKDYFQKLRGSDEGPYVMGPFGMRYGESPRLSRHARRRMTDVLERRVVNQIGPDVRNSVRQSFGMAHRPELFSPMAQAAGGVG